MIISHVTPSSPTHFEQGDLASLFRYITREQTRRITATCSTLVAHSLILSTLALGALRRVFVSIKTSRFWPILQPFSPNVADRKTRPYPSNLATSFYADIMNAQSPDAAQADLAGTKRKRTTESKFYAVRIGRAPGIYSTWNQCLSQVKGHKNASCQWLLPSPTLS